MALQLVRSPMHTDITNPAAPALFVRLVADAGTYFEKLPEKLHSLQEEVDVLASRDASVWVPVQHALSALRTPTETFASPRPVPRTQAHDVWDGRAAYTYTLAIASAVQQLHAGEGGRPMIPPVPEPEPETILLVHALAGGTLPWDSKCAITHALLETRLAYANSDLGDVRLAFYAELLVAMAHAACICLQADTETGSAWRAIIGGVLPPLFLYLERLYASVQPVQLTLEGVITAFIELHPPVAHWAELERVQGPMLREHIIQCMDAYGLLAIEHSAWAAQQGPVKPDDIVHGASTDVLQYMQRVETQIEARGALAPLAVQASTDPTRQLCFAHVITKKLLAWAAGGAEMERVAALCDALAQRGVCDALLLYCTRGMLTRTLLLIIEQLNESQWQDGVALEWIADVLLLTQRLAKGDMAACLAAAPQSMRLFLLHDKTPVVVGGALCDSSGALLERWCAALVGSDGVSDELLQASSPKTMYQLAPAITYLLIEAHALKLIDKSALHSALSYFLQAPLRYTLPCILFWLMQQVRRSLATAVYLQLADVHLEMLLALFRAASFPDTVRTILREPMLDLLQHERIASHPDAAPIHAQLEQAALPRPIVWPCGALEKAIAFNAQYERHAADAALVYTGDLGNRTYLALAAIQHMDTKSTRLLAAVLAMALPQPPLQWSTSHLAILIVRAWNTAAATHKEIQNMAHVMVASAVLAWQMRDGVAAVQLLAETLANIADHSPPSVQREIRVELCAPLYKVAGTGP
ncbi:hypothetical protein MVES1_001465 [Malassezia vespertilionis]|uniref:uncharacterized protein n=1 Tax=Malassezia vespertilionis TaxID=2020962 RepID=UPI0024B26D1F|nr:uncharacterized protein MVES1_001465 [Malassezia vespertilionis]WFD06124.1 hypothetical protein MVES1_001465 [Malassezia vespertilionis]